MGMVFFRYCQHGQIDQMDLKNTPQAIIDQGMYIAATVGQLSTIQHLLQSGELPFTDIHVDYDRVFKIVCAQNHEQVLHYLIFDYKIEKTEEINNYLTTQYLGCQLALQLFEKRQLNETLHQDLPHVSNFPKRKI